MLMNNIKMILHESEGTILKQKIIDILKIQTYEF